MKQVIQFAKRTVKLMLSLLYGYHFKHKLKNGQYNKNLLILMYHRVLPSDDLRLNSEEPGMYVTPDTLNMHLEELAKLATFIGIEDWLKLSANKQLKNTLYCAITFDDGWADNHEFALPLLTKHKVPATIFLATNYIGSSTTFWPERLYNLLNRLKKNDNPKLLSDLTSFFDSLDQSLDLTRLQSDSADYVASLINQVKVLTDDKINVKLDQIETNLPTTTTPLPAMLNWQQVAEMKTSGFEIGGHTRSHLRLNTKATTERIEQEVTGCAEDIKNAMGETPTLFCYPNGDTSEAAVSMVENTFNAAVTTQSGINKEDAKAFLLKRIGAHQDATNTKTKFLGTLGKAV
jgi:peptidoglycan/xylan/chitin deacetylase (PgdA/CDA1 family)